MKYTKTPLHKLADLGRGLALFVFIVSISTTYLWNYNPEVITYLDKRIVKLYERHYLKLFRSAREEVNKNGIDGLSRALSLAEKLENIKKMDRLAPRKRLVLDLISTTYEDFGDHEQALFWLNQWIAFDEKDLVAKVRAAQAMMNITGQEETGEAVLKALYQRVPEAEFVADAYMDVLLNDEEYVSALKVANKYLVRNYTSIKRYWHVFWDLGEGFSDKLMIAVMPAVGVDGVFSLNFELPADVTRLRLDPPANSLYKIKQPTLLYNKDVSTVWTQQIGFNHASQAGDSVITTGGGDPYFYWSLTEFYAPGGAVTFTADVGLKRLDSFDRALSKPLVDKVEAAVLSTNDSQVIASFREAVDNAASARIASMKNIPLSIYWSSEEKFFSEQRTAKENVQIKNGRFEVVLPVGSSFKKLRVDFPDNEGVTFVIEHLQWMRGEIKENIDVDDSGIILKNNIEVSNSSFLITGKDPHFAIATELIEVDNILISGVIK